MANWEEQSRQSSHQWVEVRRWKYPTSNSRQWFVKQIKANYTIHNWSIRGITTMCWQFVKTKSSETKIWRSKLQHSQVFSLKLTTSSTSVSRISSLTIQGLTCVCSISKESLWQSSVQRHMVDFLNSMYSSSQFNLYLRLMIYIRKVSCIETSIVTPSTLRVMDT